MLDLVQMFVRYLVVAYGLNLGFTGEMNEALAGAAMTFVAIAWSLKKNGYWDKFKAWLSAKNMV